MNDLRVLRVLVAVGAVAALSACGGGSSSGGGPAPAASTDFNPFVLSTLAAGEGSEPIEVNDLAFEYSDDDDDAFASVVAGE